MTEIPEQKAVLPHSVSCQTCIKYKIDILRDTAHFFQVFT